MPSIAHARKGFLTSITARLFGGAGSRRKTGKAAGSSTHRGAARRISARKPARQQKIPRKLANAQNTYVFDLAPIRHRLRNHWDRLNVSVHRVAERMFLSDLDGMGTYQRFGDTYVITFDRLTGIQAKVVGQHLYKQFEKLLFHGIGEQALTQHFRGGHSPRGKRRRRRGLFQKLIGWLKTPFVGKRPAGAPSAEAAGEMDASSAAAGSASGGPANGDRPSGESPASDGGVMSDAARTKSPVARPASGSPPRDAGDDGAAWSPPYTPNAAVEKLNLLREARSIENGIISAVLKRTREWSAELADHQFPPPDLNFIYRSMWNLDTKHLTTFTSVPVCWKNSMEVLHGDHVVPPPRRPEHLLALDNESLENTIEILERFLEEKRQILFMNTVHASTLANKERCAEFTAIAARVPARARANLIFEIVDIEEFAYRPEAAEMIRHLSSYGRAISVSVGLDDRNFAFWKEFGVMAIGANLAREERSEIDIIHRMDNFAKQAKRHRLISYLRELDKFSMTISAVGAGFEFLEGATIGSSDDPDNLSLANFDLEDLYSGDVKIN